MSGEEGEAVDASSITGALPELQIPLLTLQWKVQEHQGLTFDLCGTQNCENKSGSADQCQFGRSAVAREEER